MNYTLEIVKDFDQLERLRPAWETLAFSPNSDLDYFIAVCQSRPEVHRPHIIVVKKNDTVITIVVCRLEYKTLEAKIGYKILYKPRFLSLTVLWDGILGDTSKEISSIIVNSLEASLKNKEAELVYFTQLKTTSSVFQAAIHQPSRFSIGRFRTIRKHWQLALPESFDAYLMSMSHRSRRNMRTTRKHLIKKYKSRLVVKKYGDVKEVETFMADSEMIAKKTYHRGLNVGFTDQSETRRRMTVAAEAGWLLGYVLYIDGRPRAFNYGYLYGNTFFGGSMAYDPKFAKDSLGKFLLLELIEDLCHNAAVEFFDFGQGDAEYKHKLGDRYWEEASAYILAPTMKGIMNNMSITSIHFLSLKLKSLVEKIGLVNKVKKKWRTLKLKQANI